MRKPPAKGPKPVRYCSCEENPTIVVVRPWKFSTKTRISLSESGTPLTVCPHLRVILIAVSTPSAPLFIGRKRGNPVSSQISLQKGPSWSLKKAREVSVRRRAWRSSAASSRGWQCPWLTAE